MPWIRGLDLMGRTKRRHRAWKQQMKARARKRRDWGFSWGDISPGRLVAWAEWEEGGETNADCREKVQNNLCGSALE